MESKEKFFKRLKKKIGIVRFLFLGYAITILVGSLLLSLSYASATGVRHSYIDCLFTATSATCVTGLVPFDTGSGWSLFGQIVILLLIQIGGLGFMTIICVLFVILKQRISIHDQNIVIAAEAGISRAKVAPLVVRIAILTFIFEMLGTGLLCIRFCRLYSGKGVYYALFTSISAFCNAGFDVFTTGSLSQFRSDPFVLLVVSFLIVSGGLGFIVWMDIFEHKFRIKKYSLHTKVVLLVTSTLIIASAIIFYILEFTDLGVKGNFTNFRTIDKITNSIFFAISPRTAGFSAVDLKQMSGSGQFLTIILMFIGGNPCSTAGGVKTTTIVVVVASLIASAKGEKEIRILHRRVNAELGRQSLAIFFSYLLLIMTAVLLIGIFDQGNLTEILFETTSAVCTVGLTLDYTATLGVASKIILIFLMYVGRLGAFAFFEFLFKNNKKEYVSFPEGKILVG